MLLRLAAPLVVNKPPAHFFKANSRPVPGFRGAPAYTSSAAGWGGVSRFRRSAGSLRFTPAKKMIKILEYLLAPVANMCSRHRRTQPTHSLLYHRYHDFLSTLLKLHGRCSASPSPTSFPNYCMRYLYTHCWRSVHTKTHTKRGRTSRSWKPFLAFQVSSSLTYRHLHVKLSPSTLHPNTSTCVIPATRGVTHIQQYSEVHTTSRVLVFYLTSRLSTITATYTYNLLRAYHIITIILYVHTIIAPQDAIP